MKLTIFKNYYVCLMISDHSRNADKIYEKLSELLVFDEIHYIKTKELITDRNCIDKIQDCIYICFMKKNRYSYILSDISDKFFNELICYNYGVDIYGLYAELYNSNKDIKISLYEEGILSYGVTASMNYKKKIIKIIRHMLCKKDITEAFSTFYCFYPELYKGSLSVHAVPQIKLNSECSDILSRLFNVSSERLTYQEKYIFFTSVYDFEGGSPIGEYEVACAIRKIVGENNLLIKTHPRDIRTIYEVNGFKVDKNSSLPWEVIQLSKDFSNYIFLTVSSGSVLAGSLMSTNPVDTFYLYKCCDLTGNLLAQKTANDIYNLLSSEKMKKIFKNVKIVERLVEIDRNCK